VQVIQHGPVLGGAGEIDTLWEIEVSWSEARRIDVRDSENHLVGQFLLLEDDGSFWRAERTGFVENQGDCLHTSTTYEASGSGEKTLQHAWVYFSFSDRDPLKELLPNGSYYVGADPSQFVQGTAHYRSEDCDGDVFEQTRDDRGMAMSFMLSRHLVHPLSDGPASISAEAFRSNLERAAEMESMGIRIMDLEKRTVTDNVMAGRYTSVGGFLQDDTLSWDVEWHITRIRDVKARFHEPDDHWRP